MSEFWLNPDLLVLAGSHLYGCSTPNSDRDTRGFVVEPAQFLLGRETWELYESEEEDHVVWGFRKFMKLLEAFSPNTVEILFAPKENVIECSEAGQMLIDNRSLFLAKRLAEPMNKFALNEWAKAMNEGTQTRKLGDQRKGHIEKFGYSVKNAYHAIRLLEECIEFLEYGTITFPRPNADFLRKVRHGEVSKEEVVERWDELAPAFTEAILSSDLPESIDRNKTEELYYAILERPLKSFALSRYGEWTQ